MSDHCGTLSIKALFFFYKKWVHFILYKTFKCISENWNKWNRLIIFDILFFILFMNRYHIGRSPFSGKIPGRKMKYRGLHSPLSQIWNMRMLIQSNPYALLGFNFLITVNPLDTNPIKWSNTLKQFLHFFWRIVWLCLTILWGWRVTLIWVGLFRSSSWSGETGEGKITSTV